MSFDSNDDPQTGQASNSRRRFLAGSAALGGIALGGAFATQPVFAGDDEDDDDDAPPAENPTAGEFEDDVDVLNYALTLEYLEAAFYNEALDNITPKKLKHAETLDSFDADHVREHVYESIEVIRDHEETHAETLAAVITDLGGEPVEMPEFDFGDTTQDPDAFLATAAALEDTGVSAYNGAIASIESPGLQTAGATVATVEGRHASFVRVLNGEIGFPRAFDRARSREEVLEIASDFIVED